MISKIPINSPLLKNIDEQVINSLSTERWNNYLERTEEGYKTVRRPVFDLLSSPGTYKKIHGLYWWREKEYTLGIAKGNFYTISTSSATFSALSGGNLGITNLCSFASNGDYVAVANGGTISYTDGSTVTEMNAANDPTTTDHIVFLDQYLIAMQAGSGTWKYCDFAFGSPPSSFVATDFFTAESNSDAVLAVTVLNRELVFLGDKTTEFWYNAGTTKPFRRIEGKIYDLGIASKYAFVNTGERLFWMTEDRRLVVTSGGAPESIKTTFDKELQQLTTISDMEMYFIPFEGKEFLILQFPTEEVSYVWEIRGNSFSKWSRRNETNSNHEALWIQAYTYAEKFNQHIFGSRFVDVLYKMSSTAGKDHFGSLTFELVTGRIDHGTKLRKTSERLTLDALCGVGDSSNPDYTNEILLYHRDNGEKEWSSPYEVSLGAVGEYENIINIYGMGQYRTRQYKFITTADVPIILNDLEEEFEVDG